MTRGLCAMFFAMLLLATAAGCGGAGDAASTAVSVPASVTTAIVEPTAAGVPATSEPLASIEATAEAEPTTDVAAIAATIAARPRSAAAILDITGAVTTSLALTREDLEQFPQVDVPASVTGGEEGFAGPRLADVLTAAGVAPSAGTVIFTAADGTTRERPLDELQGRFDVLIAVHGDGRLQIIDPRQDDPVAFDNLVHIEVT